MNPFDTIIGLEKDIATTVFEGLLNAYKNHIKLAENGKFKDKINRFGDMALRGDVEAEENIFNSLKKLSENLNLHIICKSEELGDQDLNTGGGQNLFAVFDGLDGSSNYLNKNEFGYGTMFAIAKNDNPKYEDFIVAGLAMMEEGLIVLGIKNEGIYIYEIAKETFIKLPEFGLDEIFSDQKTLANKYFPEEIDAYGNKMWTMTGSTAWSIFSLITKDDYNALIEVTRKKNLEQPILYLLITELGGVMVDKDGNSIGSNIFKVWGQKRDGEEYLITSKNINIAKDLIKSINI